MKIYILVFWFESNHIDTHIIELSVKCVQKRKLRANFIKNGISTSQGAKSSLVVVWLQV
jgi:hypothetical protein